MIEDVAEDGKEEIAKHFLRTSSYVELFDILAIPKPAIQPSRVVCYRQESLQHSRCPIGYLLPCHSNKQLSLKFINLPSEKG